MITALIVAGGRATRMGGVDKHALVVEGRTIFERQVAVLAPRVAEILVSAPRPVVGYRTVADAVPGGGPLGGIAAGLAAARTAWVLVVAGDMPHVSGALVDLVLAQRSPDLDAVGIRIGDRAEPLFCALRAVPCAAVVNALVAATERRASALLSHPALRVAWLDEAAVRAVDPELRALHNVNVPEDLRG